MNKEKNHNSYFNNIKLNRIICFVIIWNEELNFYLLLFGIKNS